MVSKYPFFLYYINIFIFLLFFRLILPPVEQHNMVWLPLLPVPRDELIDMSRTSTVQVHQTASRFIRTIPPPCIAVSRRITRHDTTNEPVLFSSGHQYQHTPTPVIDDLRLQWVLD
jgi:hypothetical protein